MACYFGGIDLQPLVAQDVTHPSHGAHFEPEFIRIETEVTRPSTLDECQQVFVVVPDRCFSCRTTTIDDKIICDDLYTEKTTHQLMHYALPHLRGRLNPIRKKAFPSISVKGCVKTAEVCGRCGQAHLPKDSTGVYHRKQFGVTKAKRHLVNSRDRVVLSQDGNRDFGSRQRRISPDGLSTTTIGCSPKIDTICSSLPIKGTATYNVANQHEI